MIVYFIYLKFICQCFHHCPTHNHYKCWKQLLQCDTGTNTWRSIKSSTNHSRLLLHWMPWL